MIPFSKIRGQLMAMTPAEALDHLAKAQSKIEDLHESQFPLLTVYLNSGVEFRGHLLSSAVGRQGRNYIFSLEVQTSTDAARDIMFVNESKIDAVVFWDIEYCIDFVPKKTAA